MKRIIDYFIRYPIWANVLMLSVMLFGTIAFLSMRYSFFPEIRTDIITIQVTYPGASPEEVEEGVVLKIEESLEGLEGVERITSVSRENFGVVSVEISEHADFEKALTEVKNAVDQINSFPVGVEKPVVFEQPFRRRAITVALYGQADLFNLKVIAEHLRDELLATPEISLVSLHGLPRPEISIEVSEAELRRYGLTFDEIAAAVRGANIDLSGGKLDTREEEILIRARGKQYYARELENIPLRANPDGTIIYLKDVAAVREKWEDVPERVYYNGQPAVTLIIDKTLEEDILAIARRTRQVLADFNTRQEQVQAVVVDDRTIHLRQRLNLLKNNGLLGLLLVVLTVGFFMNLRLSWWISVGIPFAFAGMFIIIKWIGLTINAISTFGMIIVVGILVDDAIVVGENIYSHYERGKTAIRAAIDGTLEVLAPVFTSVATTIIAFLPFFFLEGFMGKHIWHAAAVVVASLVFSLIEAFFVLPSHLAHSRGLHPHKEDPWLRRKIERAIHFFTHRLYAPLLQKALRRKVITLITPIALIFVTVGLLRGGFIGATFFPNIDQDFLPINVSLTTGRQEAHTDSVLAHIERVCWQVNRQYKQEREDGRDVILGILREIGVTDFGESGSHTGKLTLELLDGETRNLESSRIAARIREAVGTLPEVQNITYGQQGFFGKPVSISLLGNHLEQLNRARDLLVAELENMGELKDITDSNQEGRRELNITLKPKAYSLGLTLQEVARQVRQGFFGQEVQRIQRGRDEVRVWVRYRPEDRAALGFLDQMRIRTPSGAEYPFSELAEYTIRRGLTAVYHLDKKREIKVEANLADEDADLPPILARIREEIIPRVLSQVHGVQVSFEGQARGRAKEQRSIARAFPVAFLAMFIMLILVFRSYAQAVLIMSIIPFGVLGAIWGHGIQGIQLSFLSIYGFIALAGIIINDGIVLIHQINRNLRAGQSVEEAVFNGAVARLRPILLTSLTTAFGLAPLILETSRQAQFLIPMAISVAYGLLFGTFLLLLVLPAGFLVLNRLRLLAAHAHQRLRAWMPALIPQAADGHPIEITDITPESVEPAVKEMHRNHDHGG